MQKKYNKQQKLNIIITGAKDSGKTALYQAIQSHGHDKNDSLDFSEHSLRAYSLHKQNVPNVIVFVGDLSSVASFEQLTKNIEMHDKFYGHLKHLKILLMNKTDNPNRLISLRRATSFAKDNQMFYYEASVTNNTYVSIDVDHKGIYYTNQSSINCMLGDITQYMKDMSSDIEEAHDRVKHYHALRLNLYNFLNNQIVRLKYDSTHHKYLDFKKQLISLNALPQDLHEYVLLENIQHYQEKLSTLKKMVEETSKIHRESWKKSPLTYLYKLNFFRKPESEQAFIKTLSYKKEDDHQTV